MDEIKSYFSLNNKAAFDRAKAEDEPFVMQALIERGWKVRPGTHWEDLKHNDLIVLNAGKETTRFGSNFSIDVKRVLKSNAKSNNFLLTVLSRKCKLFPFNERNYFAFIDDEDKSFYLVNQKTVEKLCEKYYLYHSKYNNSYYKLIPKYDIKQVADLHIHPSESVKWILR